MVRRIADFYLDLDYSKYLSSDGPMASPVIHKNMKRVESAACIPTGDCGGCAGRLSCSGRTKDDGAAARHGMCMQRVRWRVVVTVSVVTAAGRHGWLLIDP